MKKTFLALVLSLPLAGCAHQQGGYAGGGGGYFADDSLYSYGCNDEYYRQGYFYGYTVSLQSFQRTPLRHGGTGG